MACHDISRSKFSSGNTLQENDFRSQRKGLQDQKYLNTLDVLLC